MKILLVKPQWFVHGGQYRYLEHIRFTPLSLGILAALSGGHEVRIADGDWEEIPYGDDFDLVGISATTFTSERAFELAAKFRSRAKVVLGGVHPSILPGECLEHADSIVVGEAEYVWGDVLRDAELMQVLLPTFGPVGRLPQAVGRARSRRDKTAQAKAPLLRR